MLIRGRDCPVEPTHSGAPKQVYMRGGVLPDVTQVAMATLEQGGGCELHSHPTMYEIYYVLSGRALYRVGGEEYDVAPGDMVIVPPATPHCQKVVEGPHRIFYWGIAVKP